MKYPPQAVRGVLDLRNWDLNRDGGVELLGEWEYYEGQLLEPDDFTPEIKPAFQAPRKPLESETLLGDQRKILKPVVYGTYRLKVHLPDKLKIISINISDVAFASQLLWIDKNLFHQNGTIEKYAYNNFFGRKNILIAPDAGSIVITLQAGYLARSLIINSHQNHAKIVDRKTMQISFMLACMAIIGFYHLWLFAYIKKDTSTLIFSLMCFFYLLSTLLNSYPMEIADAGPMKIISWIIINLNFFIYVTMRISATFLFTIFGVYFAKELFPGAVSGKTNRFFKYIMFLYFCVGIIFNVIIYDSRKYASILFYLHNVMNVFSLCAGIYALWIVNRARMLGFKNASIILGGTFIFLLIFIYNATIILGLHSLPRLSGWGMLIVIFSQAIAIAKRFSMALVSEEHLTSELIDLNFNLEQMVLDRTEKLKNARDSLWSEMQLAKKIQTVLLPIDPRITGYEISIHMDPAEDVGGDYYDIISSDTSDWLMIGDVSGHGVSAGIVMMMVQTAIQTIVRKEPDIDPAELLLSVNTCIKYNVKQLKENKYITINALKFKNDGTIIHAGRHEKIILYHASTKSIECVETYGLWLGLAFPSPHSKKNSTLQMEAGDVMLLYTDGITEAREVNAQNALSEENNMYGENHLIDVFGSCVELPVNTIKETIIRSLEEKYMPHDDVTIIVVKKIV